MGQIPISVYCLFIFLIFSWLPVANDIMPETLDKLHKICVYIVIGVGHITSYGN
jgi:hypothetical protein